MNNFFGPKTTTITKKQLQLDGDWEIFNISTNVKHLPDISEVLDELFYKDEYDQYESGFRCADGVKFVLNQNIRKIELENDTFIVGLRKLNNEVFGIVNLKDVESVSE